jgi:DNA-binding Lrp family transcriptional regulator
METETLFTASKWGILQEISLKPSSPFEIAEKLKTTIANVSQQMRLLEAAGLITRTKVSNSEAGKPRALFSLTNNVSFLAVATKGGAKKSIIKLNKEQLYLSKVWLLNLPEVISPLSRFYYSTDAFFSIISELYFKEANTNSIYLDAKFKDEKEKAKKYEVVSGDKKYSIIVNNISNSKDQSKGGELLYFE